MGDVGENQLVKASLCRVDTQETLQVLWNPAWYRIERRSRLHAPEVLGPALPERLHASGLDQRFETELFIDTTELPHGPGRNARGSVERLSSWMAPVPGSLQPPKVVFVWGPFRFDGFIESLEEEWIRFDPDGTPVRAWLGLSLRR